MSRARSERDRAENRFGGSQRLSFSRPAAEDDSKGDDEDVGGGTAPLPESASREQLLAGDE